MKKSARFLALLAVAASILGCQSRTDRVDSPVILTINGTTTIVLPPDLSVNAALAAGGSDAIGSMTLTVILKDPNGTATSLESVELESYQVTYTRQDRGTRVPPALTESLFGNITVGGTMTLTGFPYIRTAQLSVPPLSDLGATGVDPETGSQTILLGVNIQFFGHTLSGKAVSSEVKTFTQQVSQ